MKNFKEIERQLKTVLKHRFSIKKSTVIQFLMLGMVFATSSRSLAITEGTATNNAIAIGSGSVATSESLAVGVGAKTENTQSVAIGNYAKASGDQSVAIGGVSYSNGSSLNTEASGNQSMAIGGNVKAYGNSSIAIGGDDTDKVKDQDIVYNGKNMTVDAALIKASGISLNAQGHWYPTITEGGGSIAIGVKARALKALSLSLGTASTADGVLSLALGAGAYASRDNSIALGPGSSTKEEAKFVELSVIKTLTETGEDTGKTITYKNFAGGSENLSPGDQVSIGSKGFERQIKHLAPGEISKTSTDAINGSQLASIAGSLQGSIAKNAKDISNIKAKGTQLPIVYTDKDGNKLYKQEDGTFKKNADGSGDTVTEVITSLQGGDESTTNPVELANVKSGIDSEKIGKGKIEKDTAIEVASKLNDLDDTKALNTAATVGDLQALSVAGLTFTDNKGNKIHKKLGETLQIKGGNDGTSVSDKNTYVEASTDGKLVVKFAETPLFKEIKLGEDGAKTTLKTDVDGDLSIEKPVASGTATPEKVLTDKNYAEKVLLSYKVNDEADTAAKKVTLQKGLTFKGDANITVESEANGVITHKLNKDLTGIDSIGKTDGAKIAIGADTVTLSKGSDPVKLTGIKSGEISDTSKDAITGKQLKGLADKLGLTPDSNGEFPDLTDMPQLKGADGQDATASTSILDAIKANATALNRGFKIRATDNTGADDKTQYLGSTTTFVEAGSTGITKNTVKYNGSNLTTKYTYDGGNGKVEIGFKETPLFKGLELGEDGAKTTLKTDVDGDLSIEKPVASGTATPEKVLTDKNYAEKVLLSYKVNDEADTAAKKVTLQKGLTFKGDANITVESEANGVITHKLNKDLTGIDSIGKTDGAKIAIGADTVTLSKGSDPVKLTGIKSGEISDTSKDAITGKQLKGLADKLGLTPDSNGEFPDLTDMPQLKGADGQDATASTSILDAIKANATALNRGFKIRATDNTGADDKTQYLGSTTIFVEAGSTGITKNTVKYNGSNLTTKYTYDGGNGKVEIGFKETPLFKGLELGEESNKITLTPGTDGTLILAKDPVGTPTDDKVVLKGLKDGIDKDSAVTKKALDDAKSELKTAADSLGNKALTISDGGTEDSHKFVRNNNEDKTLKIIAGNIATDYKDTNLKTEIVDGENGNKILNIGLKESPEFKEIKLGEDGAKTTLKTDVDGDLSIEKPVASGTATPEKVLTDKNYAEKVLLSYKVNDEADTAAKKVTLQKGLTFKGDANITVESEANGVITHKLNKDLTGIDSIGKTDGAKIAIGADTVTLSKGSDPVKLTGIKSGEISDTSKDAITGKQLKGLADKLGLTPDSNGEFPDLTDMPQLKGADGQDATASTSILDAIKANATALNRGFKIRATDNTGADDKTQYLGSTTTFVEAGSTGITKNTVKYNGSNLTTKYTYDGGNGKVEIGFKETPLFKGLELGEESNKITLTPGTDGTLTLANNPAGQGNDGGKVELKGLKAGTDDDSAVTKGQLDDLTSKTGDSTKDDQDARNTAGTAGNDGLNGKSLNDKINAVRRGEAGTVVYTNAAGERLVKAKNGKFYKLGEVDKDGEPVQGAKPVETSDVIASLVNPDGETTEPTRLANISSGLDNTKIGKGLIADADAKTAVDKLNKLVDTNILNSAATLGDLQAISVAGLNFAGNNSVADIHKKLGETLEIQGGYTGNEKSSKNTYVENDGSKLVVKIAETPEFKGLELKASETAKKVKFTPDEAGNLTLSKDVAAGEDNKVVLNGLKEGTTADSAVTKGQLDKLAEKSGDSTKDDQDTRNTGTGAAAKDGLNGKSLNDKINAVRRGEAGPVVYTNKQGDRLVKAKDGKFYKAEDVNPDGTAITGKQSVDNVVTSLVNPDGTTTAPTSLANISSGIDSEKIGKGKIEKDTAIEVASKLNDLDDTKALNTAATVGDLQALSVAGLTFTDNKGNKIHKKLGETLQIKGGNDGTSVSDKNTYVEASTDGKLVVKFAETPEFKGLELKASDGAKKVKFTPDADGNLTLSNDSTGEEAGKVELKGLKEGTTADSAVTKGQLDKLAEKSGDSSKDAEDARNTGTGAAAKDGLNGKSLNDKINAVRRGEAGPVVYTNKQGDRLVKAKDGKFYKAEDVNPDGTAITGKQSVDNVVTSLVNPDGTTTNPTTLGNIASGIDPTKVGVDPASGEEAAPIKDDVAKAVTETLNGIKDKNKLNTAATVGDLQAISVAGLTFGGNSGTDIHKKLGEKLEIIGAHSKENTSDKNTYVEASTDGKLVVKFADRPEFDEIKIKGTDANNPIVINSDGIDLSGKAITNVKSNLDDIASDTAVKAAPTDETIKSIKSNAATVNDVLNAGFNIQGNGNAVDFVKAYDTVNFVDGLNTVAKVEKDNNGVVSVKYDVDLTELKDNNPFEYVDANDKKVVKLGDNYYPEGTKLKEGRPVDASGNATEALNTKVVKLGDNYYPAGTVLKEDKPVDASGQAVEALNPDKVAYNISIKSKGEAKPLKNIADGKVEKGSKEAVNGGQLFAITGGVVSNGVPVDESGKPMLKTYNVDGQGEYVQNSVYTAIQRMNEEGIKFFHVNDGTKEGETKDQTSNTEDASAGGLYSAAIGYKADASGNESVALGHGAKASGEQSIAIGTGNIVTGAHSGAIGDPNTIKADSSYAVGNDNTINTENTFVLGNNVTETHENSIFLGDSSAYVEADSTTAGAGKLTQQTLGGGVVNEYAGGDNVVGVLSVGNKGQTRRIQNVAPGLISKDSRDAINGSQLYSVNDKVNNALSGVANAIATANLTQVSYRGDYSKQISAGYGYYGNEHALGLGFSGITEGGKVIYKLSGSINTRGKIGVGVGLGYQFDKKNRGSDEYAEKISKLENQVRELTEKVKENRERLYVIDNYVNDKFSLTKTQIIKLKAIVKEINEKYSDRIIDITGYTDTNASDRYNLDLGLKRANKIQDVMIELGLKNPQNIRKVSSFGFNNKVNSSFGENRRVEIIVK
ncbi:OmpA family protein [Oceanivirga miroungae]|uniref:Hsf n=1 Tax=Oceanivirga miroungae TaxID=1130046 RepID=A0A6I8M6C9_9FUSO|nr:OmpA family protein [Oceanivirga miroungae]VWL84994.1 Hsf [Oceanivirga miroungae]